MGWLRDLVRENGEAKNPGPSSGPVVRVGDTAASRVSGPLGFAFASVAPLSAAGYLRAVLAFLAWSSNVGDPSVPLEDALVWNTGAMPREKPQVPNMQHTPARSTWNGTCVLYGVGA